MTADGSDWAEATALIRGGITRTGFDETAYGVQLTGRVVF